VFAESGSTFEQGDQISEPARPGVIEGCLSTIERPQVRIRAVQK